LQHFDTSRGIFTEGGPAFEGAGIQKKNHIQICIRNKTVLKHFLCQGMKLNFPNKTFTHQLGFNIHFLLFLNEFITYSSIP
jgi:hypothetical protein